MPAERAAEMNVAAFDRRESFDPVDPGIASPGRAFDALDFDAGAVRQRAKRRFAPTGQMMWRRIDEEVRDPGHRRLCPGNADANEAAGPRRRDDFGEQRFRIPHVLDDLEAA